MTTSAIEPGAQLTPDALLALQDWLYHYLTGRLSADSLIADYRTEELTILMPGPGRVTHP